MMKGLTFRLPNACRLCCNVKTAITHIFNAMRISGSFFFFFWFVL
jgi:hypothetical protein